MQCALVSVSSCPLHYALGTCIQSLNMAVIFSWLFYEDSLSYLSTIPTLRHWVKRNSKNLPISPIPWHQKQCTPKHQMSCGRDRVPATVLLPKRCSSCCVHSNWLGVVSEACHLNTGQSQTIPICKRKTVLLSLLFSLLFCEENCRFGVYKDLLSSKLSALFCWSSPWRHGDWRELEK